MAYRRKYAQYGAMAGMTFLRPYVSNMINQAFKYKNRQPNSYTKTKGKNPKYAEQTVTTQYDTKQQYRYKRMPRKQKRRWVKFTKKVHQIAHADLGLRTVLFNDRIDLSYEITPLKQTFGAVHLYGGNGINVEAPTGVTREIGARDLRQIYINDGNIDEDSQVQFRNAVVDITMTNVDSQTLEVDVYKIKYLESDNPQASCINTFISNPNLPLASLDLTLADRGATPFDLGRATGLMKAKILSKRKYLLSPQQSATYQHREAANHWMKGYEMQPNAVRASTDFTTRYTTTFLIIAKNVDATAGSAHLRVGATRNYRYKVNLATVNKPLSSVEDS